LETSFLVTEGMNEIFLRRLHQLWRSCFGISCNLATAGRKMQVWSRVSKKNQEKQTSTRLHWRPRRGCYWQLVHEVSMPWRLHPVSYNIMSPVNLVSSQQNIYLTGDTKEEESDCQLEFYFLLLSSSCRRATGVMNWFLFVFFGCRTPIMNLLISFFRQAVSVPRIYLETAWLRYVNFYYNSRNINKI